MTAIKRAADVGRFKEKRRILFRKRTGERLLQRPLTRAISESLTRLHLSSPSLRAIDGRTFSRDNSFSMRFSGLFESHFSGSGL